ncbi:hypothetical protein N9C31_01095 [Gammaproteobacteria bacterium]|nr:hypothetical protein [Gammaproteobacteria bacterium]
MKTHFDRCSLFDIVGVYLTGIVSFLASFFLGATIAQHLGVEEFGSYHVAIKTSIFISNILVLGQPLAIRIFLSQAMLDQSQQAALNIIHWTTRQLGRIGMICVGVFILRELVLSSDHFLDIGFTALLRHPLSLVVITIPFLVLVNLLPPILDVLHHFKLSRLTQSVLGHACYCFLLVGGSHIGIRWSVSEMILLYLLAQFLVILIVMMFIWGQLRWIWKGDRVVSSDHVPYRQTAIWGLISNGSYQLVLNFSSLLVILIVADGAQLSHFSAIMTIVNFYFLLSESLRGYLSQKLLELSRVDKVLARKLLMEAMFYNAIGTIVIYFAGTHAQSAILSFFGESYLQDLGLLHFALTINALVNIFQPFWSVFEYTQPRFNAYVCLAHLGLGILTLGLLIPIYGLWGAFVGDVLPEFLILICLGIKCMKEYGLFSRKAPESLAQLMIND